jgi:hypothetical protein
MPKIYNIPEGCAWCKFAEIIEKEISEHKTIRGTIHCQLHNRIFIGLLEIKPRFCGIKSVEG